MDKNEQILVNLEKGIKTLEIREGQALPLREPLKFNVSGTINTVTRYLEKLNDTIDPKKAVLKVDREAMMIVLEVDPEDYYARTVIAALRFAEEYNQLGINTGKSYTTFELADLIRMNRALFTSKEKAMTLVTELRNFKARVNQDIEKMEDKRGGADLRRSQAVESNIPEGFALQVQIFKGVPAVEIEVEIDINPNTFDCTLVSPDAKEAVHNITETCIDGEIKTIEKLMPAIVILDV